MTSSPNSVGQSCSARNTRCITIANNGNDARTNHRTQSILVPGDGEATNGCSRSCSCSDDDVATCLTMAAVSINRAWWGAHSSSAARASANRIAFLISRPLRGNRASSAVSMPPPPLPDGSTPTPTPDRESRLSQIVLRPSLVRSWYCRGSVIRVWKAGSSESIRLDVRKSMPEKYSTSWSITQTIAFRSSEEVEDRFSKKESASSSKIMAFHLAESRRISLRRFSRSSAVVPSVPMLSEYRGRCKTSATASAVRVLPTPGGPYSKNTDPSPLPRIRSWKLYLYLLPVPVVPSARTDVDSCEVCFTRALINRFRLSGRTNPSKIPSENAMSSSPSTKQSPQALAVSEKPMTQGQTISR
mmetsp:Transcript_7818/g.19407  ORF Transcript_7818/g.19407 Transcript_7818/m.19407 type:complete len:358 (+) Transcript_7818:255-1328(+)